jgi:hypothetical protein
MNAKHILFALVIAFFLYSAFKKVDVVQSIEFQGETYELTDTYRRSGSSIYMYTPGGANFLRAGKYIQVAHLPKVEMSAEEYRRRFTETLKQGDRYQKLSENAFFYVEANTSVHSVLIQEGDTFKLYGYAEIQSEEQVRNPSSVTAKPAIADEFERMISRLPPPPRSIQTWF